MNDPANIITTIPILSLLANLAKNGIRIDYSQHQHDEITLDSTDDAAFDWLTLVSGGAAEVTDWYGDSAIVPGWVRQQQTIRVRIDGYLFQAHKVRQVEVRP